MSVVISIHDDLAQRLQSEAESRSLSVEDLAIAILDDAVPPWKSDAEGTNCNRRRLELIRQSTRGDLTDQEQAELDDLQSRIDERFEAFDAGFLGRLSEMKQAVRTAADQAHE